MRKKSKKIAPEAIYKVGRNKMLDEILAIHAIIEDLLKALGIS